MSEFYLSNGSNFTLIPVMTAQENNADTIDDLIAKLVNKPPALGSCKFNQSKETRLSFTGGSWYNYLYVPHRTGVGGDNASYGNLLLFPMTGPGKAYRVTYASDHIISVEEFYTNAYPPSKSSVGLGNVDNTADSSKSVKYAASANYATNAGSASSASYATKAGSADNEYCIMVQSAQPTDSRCKLWIKI